MPVPTRPDSYPIFIGEHLIPASNLDSSCGEEDGITDDQTVSPGHACILAFVAAGDHDAGGAFHLTQDITACPLPVHFFVIGQCLRVVVQGLLVRVTRLWIAAVPKRIKYPFNQRSPAARR